MMLVDRNKYKMIQRHLSPYQTSQHSFLKRAGFKRKSLDVLCLDFSEIADTGLCGKLINNATEERGKR